MQCPGSREMARYAVWVALLLLTTLPSPEAASTEPPSTTSPPTTTSSPTTVGPTTNPRPSTARVCENSQLSNSQTNSKLSALENEFYPAKGDYSRALDLVFIVDRSKSIGQSDFDQTIATIERLITRLSELRYIIVHANYTRVALVSFGAKATVEFNGLKRGTTIDACILTDRVRDLRVETYVNQSRISEALSRIQEEMALSRQDPNRPNPRQIVWMFNDGECVLQGCAQYLYKNRTVEGWARQLRDEDIQIFIAGVGQWLNSDEKQNRLVSLVESRDYYACATSWDKIIPRLNKDVPHKPLLPFIIYNPEQPNGTGVVGPTAPPPPSWLFPVTIGSSVVAGILLLILLIVVPLLAIRRKKAREEEKRFFETQPIYAGPVMPPSVVHVRRRGIESKYGSSPYNPTDSVLVDEDLEGSNIYAAIPYPQDFMSEPSKLDKDMQGWSNYLTNVQTSNNLRHLAVRSISSDRWAITAGCKLEEKDFKELEKLMRKQKYTPHMKIKLAGNTYDIDKDGLSFMKLAARRFIQRGVKEFLLALKVYDFVIVGIAYDSEEQECGTSVYKIQNHLLDTILADPNNIQRQENLPEENVYSSTIPQRYSMRFDESSFDPPQLD